VAQRTVLTVIAAGCVVTTVLGMKAAKATGGAFPTNNDNGGIARRSAPSWNSAIPGASRAVYPGTKVSILCYQLGTGNVPRSSDKMWLAGSWSSGPGWGAGWVNQHFVQDGRRAGQAPPGVPTGATAPH
jgi:hypothetical protein